MQRHLLARTVSSPARRRVQWAGYVCFLPAIVLTVTFKLYPLAFGIFYSFTNWRGGPHWKLIGLGNYARMLKDPAFRAAMGNAVRVLVTLPLWVLIPLVLAFMIFQESYGWRFFRATFVFPYIVAPVIAGYIFSFILGVDGPANQFLRAIGLDAIAVQWFADTRTALWGLVGVALWSYFGLGVVIYLAGMANIPRDYFDAAKLDGANLLQQLVHVSIPLLLPTIGYWSVICTAGMLIWFFPYIYAVTSGGPGYASMLPEYYIYQVSTKYFDPAYASAMGMVLFVYILLVSFAQVRFMYFSDKTGGR
jgi:ABC-type sugar transport system permease subunit